MPDNDVLPSVPEARAVSRKRTGISFVWLIPLVAAAAGVWVAVTRIMAEGPEIKIQFQTAEGLEAGKTKIQYNGVDVGTVTTIELTADHRGVVATARMAPKTENFLVDDTTFWVVRPRISGANVTGLATLISGAYIGMDIGETTKSRREFVGLDNPPVVSADVPGRYFILKTPDLGSLSTGTPIFFRRVQVGEVSAYDLDKDGSSLSIRVFVNAPYDQYVSQNTRFWQASGIDVSLNASGISVQTQSLLSILIGGIAFETPASGPVLPAAAADTVFPLYTDRAEAFKPSARDPQDCLLVFKDSVRGLAAGAPVEFRGVTIGEVVEVGAQIDAETMEFTAPVTIRLDALRLGVKIVDIPADIDPTNMRRRLIDHLIANGVRAQLRTASLITGALYIAFDIFPDAKPATIDWSVNPIRLPTIPGDLEQLEARLGNIVKKLDELPLKSIGNDVQKVLIELDSALVSARGAIDTGRGTLDNASKLIEPNSPLGAELGNTLQEVSRAARSIRVLADYLERHPEALIRGKTGEAK